MTPWLFAWLRTLFDRPERAPRIRRTHTGDPVDTDREVSVAIHQTDTLTRRLGRTPEQSVGNVLAGALADAGLGYRVELGYPGTFVVPGNEETYSDAIARWWATHANPEHAGDANLLLFDAPGGGGHVPGTTAAIQGCGRIEGVLEDTDVCHEIACRNVRGALHEVGHCLGGHHDTPILAAWPSMRYHANAIRLFRGEG